MSEINIFLDDFRIPKDAFDYTKNIDYINREWVIVRSYNEFCDLIQELKKNGTTIDSISWDHDLVAEHYDIHNNFDSYEDFLKYQHKEALEPTGYDAIMYLYEQFSLDICKKINHYVHTQNPMAKQAMLLLLQTKNR